MEKNHLTIGDACKKHGNNPNTLRSWVKKEKVVSEKRLVGSQCVYFVDEDSLLEQMAVSTASCNKPETKQEETPKGSGKLESPPAPSPAPVSGQNVVEQPETDSNESENKSKQREKPRSNIAVTRAKNSMRALELDELVRVNNWLANRISMKAHTGKEVS